MQNITETQNKNLNIYIYIYNCLNTNNFNSLDRLGICFSTSIEDSLSLTDNLREVES